MGRSRLIKMKSKVVGGLIAVIKRPPPCNRCKFFLNTSAGVLLSKTFTRSGIGIFTNGFHLLIVD